MQDSTKKLFVIPGILEIIWNIINSTHSKDYHPQGLSKFGKPKHIIPKIKNLNRMVPKYLYIIHILIREAKKVNTPYYSENGYGLSTEILKKRICERGPMVSLMIQKLIEFKVITRTKNYSNGSKTQASKYRLTKEWEALIMTATQEIFSVAEHGKFILELIKADEEYHQYQKEKEDEYQRRLAEELKREVNLPKILTDGERDIQYLTDLRNKEVPVMYFTNHNKLKEILTRLVMEKKGLLDDSKEKLVSQLDKCIEIWFPTKKPSTDITEERAIRYLQGVREKYVLPSVTYPEDIRAGILKRMDKNDMLTKEQKEGLLIHLESYIKTLPIPELAV